MTTTMGWALGEVQDREQAQPPDARSGAVFERLRVVSGGISASGCAPSATGSCASPATGISAPRRRGTPG